MPTVFVSHAEADKPVTDALFDLLQTGCDLRRESIVCTSVEGAGIQTGNDFVDWIEDHLRKANIVVLVLSPNYYASRFCVAEMGAAWALEKDVFPLMLPSIARDPGGVFLGRQSAQIDETGLDDLRDRIAKYHPDAAKGTPRWSLKKEESLDRMRAAFSKLPEPEMVTRDQLDREKERAAEAVKMYREVEGEARELREKIGLLEKAKDRADVKRIRERYAAPLERYEDTLGRVRSALSDVSRVEVRAIFAVMCGDEWLPSTETWQVWGSQLEKAKKSGWLVDTGGGSFQARREHPRLAPIFGLLEELEETLEVLSDDVRLELELEEGCLLDIRNWQFWEDQLVRSSLLE